MKKEIVGKFKDDMSKIEFFTVLFHLNNYTILRKQSYDDKRYFVYDNKDGITGILPIQEDISNDQLEKLLKKGLKIIWLPNAYVYFWADSKLVTDIDRVYYNKLKELYVQIKIVKRNYLETIAVSSNFKSKNIFEVIAIKLKIINTQIHLKRVFRKITKGLNIIW